VWIIRKPDDRELSESVDSETIGECIGILECIVILGHKGQGGGEMANDVTRSSKLLCNTGIP
jgi:hypothetical protein